MTDRSERIKNLPKQTGTLTVSNGVSEFTKPMYDRRPTAAEYMLMDEITEEVREMLQ